jgi:glutamine amidotransferase
MNTDNAYCAIIDYGMGNLFSVKNACEYVGLPSRVTNSIDEINDAGILILPGVGGFKVAMDSLNNLNLVDAILKFSHSKKPIIGICLGMQLLFEKSYEFGQHRGLGLIKGSVLKFDIDLSLKVPHMGWNKIMKTNYNWDNSYLKGLQDQTTMYFVHSFFCEPSDKSVILSKTEYGEKIFCSSLVKNNIFGVQFHPEKSAAQGLLFYQNIKDFVDNI